MKAKQTESPKRPAEVPKATPKGEQAAKQAGETQDRWSWVERSVWTTRMLTALERGVKGGKWYSLFDKIYDKENLGNSFLDVVNNRGAAGVDGESTQDFGRDLGEQLGRLGQELQRGTYRPQPVRRVYIPKLGSTEMRPLGIPAVRDRIVQTALLHVIEPIFERDFAEHSYGFRPGRGCNQALERVEKLLKEGNTWIVDADLKSYFDTIPQERLLERVKEKISDGRVLDLIESYMKQGVMNELNEWKPTETGTPQGAVISPILANIYLDPLDQLMEQSGYLMTRYADDFIVQCRTEEEAKAALKRIQEWVAEAGLTLHPTKTRLVNATEAGGFDFLGYHYERGMQWPRKKSLEKLKVTLRIKTRRLQADSLELIIQRVNRTLKGWYGYFHRSHPTTFPRIDEMVRRRLRRILLKRHRLSGNGCGEANRRWTNAYFEALGLYSLVTAQRLDGRSR